MNILICCANIYYRICRSRLLHCYLSLYVDLYISCMFRYTFRCHCIYLCENVMTCPNVMFAPTHLWCKMSFLSSCICFEQKSFIFRSAVLWQTGNKWIHPVWVCRIQTTETLLIKKKKEKKRNLTMRQTKKAIICNVKSTFPQSPQSEQKHICLFCISDPC